VRQLFFILFQSNLLGCNTLFTYFWKLHKQSLTASNGAVFYLYATLSLFSHCSKTCFIWSRISLQETKKSAGAKSDEKGGWQIHAAIRHEALHYHVRMKKEPTALLRTPKISRTLCLKLRCWGENFDLKWRNLERKNARRRDEWFYYSWHITGLSHEGNEMKGARSTHFSSLPIRVILHSARNCCSNIGVIRLFCSYIYCIDVHCFCMNTCDKIVTNIFTVTIVINTSPVRYWILNRKHKQLCLHVVHYNPCSITLLKWKNFATCSNYSEY